MKSVAAVLGSATLASAIAIAQPAAQDTHVKPLPSHAHPAFNDLDRNADGRLSFLEAKQDERLKSAFYRMDLDLDGFLSPEELRRFRA
ncbi:MAG: EF-hand domain-containing protein [Oceanospirillaceae bacterium]|nr:EF-hand domain-containing protein [Oceanospirillaceae bacterium]